MNEPKKGFVIMDDTICEGHVISTTDEHGKAVIYETAEEAWKDIAYDLREELDQFIKGERQLDETRFQPVDWVEAVEVREDGIYGEAGRLYTSEEKVNLRS